MNHPKVLQSQIINVEFGQDVTVVEPVNLYGCKIGDNCFVGPFVEIQKHVAVGNRCKIQSHSFICEYVTIGHDCFISHGVMFINDKFSIGRAAGGDKQLWKPTCIGNHVSIGTNATVLPVTIVDNTVIGAGSVVTKDILVSGIYVGNPAKLLRLL